MIDARWRRDVESEVPLHVARERGRVVAFQGERGAYGHLAVEAIWGADAPVVPSWSFERVVHEVVGGCATYGVLPVENVIVGAIPGVAALLAGAPVAVIGHVRVPVQHCLLGVPGSTVEELRQVCSHPMALAQCEDYLARHRRIATRATYDTAGAAREVAARGRRWEGAIAAEPCVARYGLVLLERDIGDRADNATRFAVIGRAR